MQNNNKKLFEQALKEDAMLNLAWQKYWAQPENYDSKQAIKVQKSLRDNSVYISDKLENNTKAGKTYVCLSAKEIHSLVSAERQAFDIISVLVKKVHEVQMENRTLKPSLKKDEGMAIGLIRKLQSENHSLKTSLSKYEPYEPSEYIDKAGEIKKLNAIPEPPKKICI